MPKGKLIIIDGTDGSGKGTQTKLLVKRLKKYRSVKDLDFPQYETFFGKLVSAYLRNEFGKIDPHLASLLYAANRFEAKEKILKWLRQGKVVVLNRYVTANQIHQASHINSKKHRREFVKWIDRMEYEIFGLPRPDLVLFLNVPPEISYQLILKKNPKNRRYIAGSKRDLLESDLEHQKTAYRQSLDLLKHTLKWKEIDCTKGSKLLTRSEVAEKVWQEVKKLI